MANRSRLAFRRSLESEELGSEQLGPFIFSGLVSVKNLADDDWLASLVRERLFVLADIFFLNSSRKPDQGLPVKLEVGVQNI